MNLARKYAEIGNEKETLRLYHEVIEKHGMDYWGNEEDEFGLYGLDAYKELIQFYQKKELILQSNETKVEMKSHYKKLLLYLKDNQKYNSFMESFLLVYKKDFE